MKFLALCLFAVLAAAAAAAPREFGAPANLADLRSRLPLDDGACDRLRRDGFVVLGDRSVRGLHNAYPKSPADAFVLVTTDALLQLWHDLYLHVIKASEERGMLPSLRAAVGPMARTCAALLSPKRTGAARAAVRDALVTLLVADRLLDGNAPVPGEVRSTVESHLAKIAAHSERLAYPGDDYTQYTVRRHYASGEALGRYFRGSMWLSRRIMAVSHADGRSVGDEPLRQAVVLAHVLRAQPEARRRLNASNAAGASLAGTPNAISVGQCLEALNKVLGTKWSLDRALGRSSLAKLRRELKVATSDRSGSYRLGDARGVSGPHHRPGARPCRAGQRPVQTDHLRFDPRPQLAQRARRRRRARTHRRRR